MKKTRQNRSLFLTLTISLVLPLLHPMTAYGVGSRIPNQDAAAIARGNAFVATADTPAALYYNPAGITQLEGQSLQLGAHIVQINSHYTAPSGNQVTNQFQIQAAPQVYYTHGEIFKDVSFGVGLYAPFGFGIEWPENSGFRTVGIEGRLLFATLQPVLAWKVSPSLSIAAGPALSFGHVKLRQGIQVPGDEFIFTGSDLSLGGNVGVRWQEPDSKWAFGAVYRSASTMDFDGSSEARPYTPEEASSLSLPFPAVVAGGVSYRPNPDWNIEFNLDWTDWGRLQGTAIKKASGDVPLVFNWGSTFIYALGLTRFYGEGNWVSLGYFLTQNSTSSAHFTPLVPDTLLNSGGIGIGKRGKSLSWATSAQVVAGPTRTVSGSAPSLAGQSADGDYRFLNFALNGSVAFHF